MGTPEPLSFCTCVPQCPLPSIWEDQVQTGSDSTSILYNAGHVPLTSSTMLHRDELQSNDVAFAKFSRNACSTLLTTSLSPLFFLRFFSSSSFAATSAHKADAVSISASGGSISSSVSSSSSDSYDVSCCFCPCRFAI